VQRLFEQEIPEIADGVIEIKAISREPGYRSKVAVDSSDSRVDCVGACVGVRGNRIKNIVDELAGERIDIVRWDDNLETLIPNALRPADVEQVILCQMLGRAIVLVKEDQLSLAIGRRGQNVRLASKLAGWDIEIMTQEELAESIDRAVTGFSALDGVETELAERLVEEGYLSYEDLSVIEPDDLMSMGGLSQQQVDIIVQQAEDRAEEAEMAAQEAKRIKKEQERFDEEMAALAPPAPVEDQADHPPTEAESVEQDPATSGQGPEVGDDTASPSRVQESEQDVTAKTPPTETTDTTDETGETPRNDENGAIKTPTESSQPQSAT